jgi:hypothetical protein
MPEKKERMTTKASWTTETMQAALNAVASGESMRKTAIKFHIPFSTIKDRVKAGKYHGPSLGNKCILIEEQDSEVEKHVLLFAKLFFGIIPTELRKIAYEFVERNGIKNKFSKECRLGSKDWLYGFMLLVYKTGGD